MTWETFTDPNGFVTKRLVSTTAEDEHNIFFADTGELLCPPPRPLPAGLYRVVDGELWRIVSD